MRRWPGSRTSRRPSWRARSRGRRPGCCAVWPSPPTRHAGSPSRVAPRCTRSSARCAASTGARSRPARSAPRRTRTAPSSGGARRSRCAARPGCRGDGTRPGSSPAVSPASRSRPGPAWRPWSPRCSRPCRSRRMRSWRRTRRPRDGMPAAPRRTGPVPGACCAKRETRAPRASPPPVRPKRHLLQRSCRSSCAIWSPASARRTPSRSMPASAVPSPSSSASGRRPGRSSP